MEGSDFVEYLELQGKLDMMTKSELIDQVRERGGRMSERQLTTWTTEGLIPKSARIGSRSGAYPVIVAELILWIDQFRSRGLSVEAIKELIPLWRFLHRSYKQRELDMQEFEYVARQFVKSREASWAVPSLFLACMPCLHCEPAALRETTFRMKDGSTFDTEATEFLPLSFAITETDEESGEARIITTTRIALPLTPVDEEAAIILGVPNGVEIPTTSSTPIRLTRGAPHDGESGSKKEV